MGKAKLKKPFFKISKNIENKKVAISNIDITPFYLPNKKGRKKSKEEIRITKVSKINTPKTKGRPKQIITERIKKQYQGKYIYKYPIIATKDIDKLATNFKENIKKDGRFTKDKVVKLLSQLVSQGKLSSKQAIEILSKYSFKSKSKEYKDQIKKQYGINVKNRNEFERQRSKVIKSGAYDMLKKEIWRQNYIKALNSTITDSKNKQKLIELLNNVSLDKIDYLSKLLDEIGLYYMNDILTDNQIDEIVRQSINTISKYA